MSGEETYRRKAEQPVSLQLFEGNMHYDTPDIRRFDPVPAQYVRVYPERWSPAGIGMRLEVLGCDWTGKGDFFFISCSLGLVVLVFWQGTGQSVFTAYLLSGPCCILRPPLNLEKSLKGSILFFVKDHFSSST